MANSLFCNSCGKKILFEAVKPKSCGYCGNNLGGGLKSLVLVKPTAPTRSAPPAPEVEIDDEDEPQYYGNLRGLDVVVNVESIGGEKLESLAYQKPEEGMASRSSKKFGKRTRKLNVVSENLPQFMKESGNTGRGNNNTLNEPIILDTPE